MSRTPLFISAALLSLTTACDFGSTRSIVSSSTVDSVLAVGTTKDFETTFVSDEAGRLLQINEENGAIEGTYWLWGGANSTAQAITMDANDDGRIWTIHSDGYVVNWSAGPSFESFFGPVPKWSNDQEICDLDHAQDGDFFVTTVEGTQSVLWRRDGTSNAWSARILGVEDCARVAHDLANDRLYILRGDHVTLEERDVSSLNVVWSNTVGGDVDFVGDIDIYGTDIFGAGVAGTPSGAPPSGSGPLPEYRMAWSWDADTGNGIDDKVLGQNGGPPVSVNIGHRASTSVFELLISSVVGNPTVRAVELEQ